jgi:TolB-like protein/DNA-binding SARP family transcriptional activator/Flp pilus assembly protein TadD
MARPQHGAMARPPRHPVAAGKALNLALFGGFAARDKAGTPIIIASKKNRALLAVLALSPNLSATRDRLTFLLWSDRDDAHARSSLRQSLALLRKELGEAQPSILRVQDETISLLPEGIYVDALEFQRLAASDDILSLRQAAELCRADLLADLTIRDRTYEEWLSGERASFKERTVRVFDRLASLETGSLRIAAAQRLLTLDPLREASHRLLMQAYVDNGENGLALKQYDTCKNLLRQELDVGPARETQELRERIAGSSSVRGAHLQPIDMGLKAVRDRPAIAVLPFANMSGDPEQQYFSDGITEDIITELSRFRELIVISRGSSFSFRGQTAPITEIAEKLGAQYVVEGSVRKSGDRVRVTAQLIDASRDQHIWAERFDRELKDIFEVQDDVVHRVTSTLVGRLEHERQERAKRQPRNALTAYDLYLRGREFVFDWSSEGNRKAAELLEKAIEIEPNYAAALALLSEVCQRNWLAGWSQDPQKDLADSYRLAVKAVESDDGDSRTHTALGIVHLSAGERDKAKYRYETAMRFNSNDVRVLVQYSRLAIFEGEPERGVQMVQRALQLNPFGKYYWYLGFAKFASHQYDDAIRLMRNIQDPSPAVLALLAASLAQLDRMDEASTTCQRYLSVAKTIPMLRQLRTQSEWRDFFVARWPFRDDQDMQHLLDALRKTGMPV